MADDGLSALERELGASVPAGVKRLDDPALQDLVDAVGEARRRQRAELAAAGEQALGHIPRLLRGPIRRLFR